MVAPPQEEQISTAPTQTGSAADVHAHVEARLSPLLGPFTAKMALKTLAGSRLGRRPEELTRKELPALFEALRPVLNTLVGAAKSSTVIDQLRKELLGS